MSAIYQYAIFILLWLRGYVNQSLSQVLEFAEDENVGKEIIDLLKKHGATKESGFNP